MGRANYQAHASWLGVTMSIVGHLKKVRDAFPECRVLAYADISTKTVLAVSSENELMQEHYNALCERAVRVLNGPATTALLSVLNASEPPDAPHVILRSKDMLTVFLKSETNAADAFCCQCGPNISVQAFLECARNELSLIGTSG